MTTPLHEMKCVPCEGGVLPMKREEAFKLAAEANGWSISENSKYIWRDFSFETFEEALDFINRVAEIAEAEGHHPDIHNYYNKVRLELTTHAIDGLSNNDFIMAAKINRL